MKLLSGTIALMLCFTLVACDKDADPMPQNTIALTGAQETPAITTSATGSARIVYDKGTKMLSYSITFANLTDSATAAHIHGIGLRGVPAPVFQTFSGFPRLKSTVNPYTGTLAIDNFAIKEVDLLAGRYYINIHSKAFPNGELRGQIEF